MARPFIRPRSQGCSPVLFAGGLLALSICHPGGLLAQEVYPNRAVRMIVPYAPGGTTDILGRLVAQRLSELWKQPVLVDNRAGASGSIGANLVAKSPANGYTIGLANNASNGAYELLNAKAAPYDTLRDFAPVSLLAYVRQVLVVHPSVPARNAREFVDLLKSRPGKLNYGSSALGSAPHFAAEQFRIVAGVDIVHVPYNGAAPAMAALLGGSIEFMFASVPTATDQVRAGKLRALALASGGRSDLLPDVPTMAEAGFPGVEMDSWFGLLAPAGVPSDILSKLNGDTRRAVDGEDVRAQFSKLGFERVTNTRESMADMLKTERDRLTRLIREAKIKGE